MYEMIEGLFKNVPLSKSGAIEKSKALTEMAWDVVKLGTGIAS